MYVSRKMKPADRRAAMMEEVKGTLARAKKASRFLSDDLKAKLKEAESFIKKAEKSSPKAVGRNVDQASILETFEYIRKAKEIAHMIDMEGEKMAKELKDI